MYGKSVVDKYKRKLGNYSILTFLIVILILITINLLGRQLNITVDFTNDQVFTLSDQSIQMIDTLEENITLISLSNAAQAKTTVSRILNEYDRVSDKITVEYIDPELHPNTVLEYQEDGSKLTYGSVVVKSDRTYKVIEGIDMFSYDKTATKIETVQVEPKITHAISYVTGKDISTIYYLVGHEEEALPESLLTTLETENYSVQDLQLMKEEWVPSRNDIVMLNGLKKDITKEELTILKDFSNKGGRLLVFDDLVDDDLPNINMLINRFGLEVTDAMIFEKNNKNTITSKNFYLVPNLTEHDIVTPLNEANYAVIMVYAQPIETLKIKKDTLVMEPLLQTSDSSYAKTVSTMKDSSNTAFKKGDLEGKFDIAVAVKDEMNKEDETLNGRLVLFSSSFIVNEKLLEASNQANLNAVMNSINWLTDRQENISIRSKDVSSEMLTMTHAQQMMISIIAIIGIPLLVIIIGAIIWYRRNK